MSQLIYALRIFPHTRASLTGNPELANRNGGVFRDFS
jgi:hypothetical protein